MKQVFLNCILIIITIISQKVIFRVFALPYNNWLLNWGTFLLIFIFINSITIIFSKKNKSLRVN
ncbi:bacteriocin-like WGxF protein [Bacillus mycoides]|uniref:bacteriocin-like WGxF protein n=1 Tax=Bacillus mycoides TaxID=1405 RepID=UPI000534E628